MVPVLDILSELAALVRGEQGHPFDRRLPIYMRSAPGRLDVLGGLASEAGGTLAQMPLPQRASVAAQWRADSQLVIHSTSIVPPLGEPKMVLPVAAFFIGDRLRPANELRGLLTAAQVWAFPLVALYYVLLQTASRSLLAISGEASLGTDQPPGATLLVHSAIAMGAGQASSTAVVTAALAALSDAAGLKSEALDLALAVQVAESLVTTANVHMVDALTCLLAMDATSPTPEDETRPRETAKPRSSGAGYLLRYSAQPHQLMGQVRIPKDLRILALDTGVRYTSAAATVDGLRLAGAMGLRIVETIYRDLGQRHTPLHGYLANLSPALYRQYFRALLPRRMRGSDFIRSFGQLPERAGVLIPGRVYRVRAAVDHLISEHDHAENFLQAMEELSDPVRRKQLSGRERELILRRAGRLVLASHHSYRLRLELSCREADWLVESLMASGPDCGIYGARITGSGGGGTVVVVLNRSNQAMDAFLKTFSAYAQIAGLQLGVIEGGTVPSAGALQSPGEVLR